MKNEELAELIHEAGLESMQAYTRLLPWSQLTENKKEGRRIQARYLAKRLKIAGKKKYLAEKKAAALKKKNR